mgnify:CR=1 FL=1
MNTLAAMCLASLTLLGCAGPNQLPESAGDAAHQRQRPDDTGPNPPLSEQLDAARRLTPTDFKRRYARVGMPESMHSTTFLGQEHGNAFLREQHMSLFSKEWSNQVFYVPLEELDEPFRATLPTTAKSR